VSASTTTLGCDWPGFARATSVAQLVSKFGASTVKALESEEGFTAVILFPKDPKQEIQLNVFNGVESSGASVEAPVSTWTIPGGVGMGASLNDVERANGRPFGIHLYKDGAGITHWNGGLLGSGDCSFFVTFKHSDPRITETSRLMSDDSSVRSLGLRVFRFGVN
jgi:hypothetical protein